MSAASGKKFREKYPYYDNLRDAKRRCEDPNNSHYRWYGEKGIKFRLSKDEGKYLWERDKAHLLKVPSLDRIESSKDYCIENCRFIELVDNVLLRHGIPLKEETEWRD